MSGNDKFESSPESLIKARSIKCNLFWKELHHRYVIYKLQLDSSRIKETGVAQTRWPSYFGL